MKAFLEINLVSLTLRSCTIFKNFEKNAGTLAALVCWAAAN